MIKRITFIVFFALFCILLPAGDAAAFVDLGFSPDCKIYMFAQHGTLDKLWQGFAEIYTVDIAKNDYIDRGCFKTLPSSKTAGINGHSIYEKLIEKNKAYIKSVSPTSANLKNTLYIKSSEKDPLQEIVFQDFEGFNEEDPVHFYIRLIPWYSGKTSAAKSSFFISVERRDKNGKVLSKQTAGNPEIKRSGVVAYAIEKITASPDRKSLIFTVEKRLAGQNGISIRYMVEALVLK